MLILGTLIVCYGLVSCGKSDTYKNTAASVDDRVESLLAQMTLEEKIGQMTQLNYTLISRHDSIPLLDTNKLRRLLHDYHIGSFLNGIAVKPEVWQTFIHLLQEHNQRTSRLKIPIIFGIDHMHGASYVQGAAIFPHNLGLAATFNDSLVQLMAKATIRQSAYLGHNWVFAPVLDIGLQPHWGRLYETFGEEPFVAAKMGAVAIQTMQSDSAVLPYKVAATAKHFLGYSDPKSGWDRTTTYYPWQKIHEIFRPSFQAAIDAGVKTVMVNSADINGIPVHGSRAIVTDLLRKTMGFKGVVVTDWEDVGALIWRHKVVHDAKEATLLALNAGIDMVMTPLSTDFCRITKELVFEGKITESRINESVRRILRLKFELGLFENPFPAAKIPVQTEQYQEWAYRAAVESLVLLKNTSATLPLLAPKTILVVGTTATSRKNLGGGWTLCWEGPPDENLDRFPAGTLTVAEALQQEFPNTTIAAVPDIGSLESPQRAEFLRLVQNVDFTVAVTGEKPYAEMNGNIEDLALDPKEEEILQLVKSSGKKWILVMVAGRPRRITDFVGSASAVIWAGLPGYEGGKAIAAVLSGKETPSGTLPFSYPRTSSHHTPYFHTTSDKSTALFPFGSGLSYTNFRYDNLRLSSQKLKRYEQLTASVSITNTGTKPAQKTVLWFVRDDVASIMRPVKQLRHYEKIHLQPGETKHLQFVINPLQHLSFPDENGKKILEPGTFTLFVGNQQQSFRYQ